MERCCPATLAADTVGYHGLIERYETAFCCCRNDSTNPFRTLEIVQNGGCVAKATGDGMLAEGGPIQKAVELCHRHPTGNGRCRI